MLDDSKTVSYVPKIDGVVLRDQGLEISTSAIDRPTKPFSTRSNRSDNDAISGRIALSVLLRIFSDRKTGLIRTSGRSCATDARIDEAR
jgi:hypothetical protein